MRRLPQQRTSLGSHRAGVLLGKRGQQVEEFLGGGLHQRLHEQDAGFGGDVGSHGLGEQRGLAHERHLAADVLGQAGVLAAGGELLQDGADQAGALDLFRDLLGGVAVLGHDEVAVEFVGAAVAEGVQGLGRGLAHPPLLVRQAAHDVRHQVGVEGVVADPHRVQADELILVGQQLAQGVGGLRLAEVGDDRGAAGAHVGEGIRHHLGQKHLADLLGESRARDGRVAGGLVQDLADRVHHKEANPPAGMVQEGQEVRNVLQVVTDQR